jgi:N,N'-diacetylbacillosaminyl-diphospho-undecaprenol alpha-1,3-N-acetylgalactosaminyltransferase
MKVNKIALIANTDFGLYNFRLGIIRALIAGGCRVSIICPDGIYAMKLRKEGVEHHRLQIDRKGTHPINEMRTLWQLYRVLRKGRFDLAHTFTIKPNIYGSIAARAAGTPVVINTVTGLGYAFIEAGGAKRRLLKILVTNLYRLAFSFSSRVIFQNEDDFELFQRYKIVDIRKGMVMGGGSGVDTEKFSGAGINPDKVRALYRELGILDGQQRVRVTLISRLLWDKGIAEFVEAARVLKPRYPSALFLLVGPIDTGNPAAVPGQYAEQAEKEGLIKYLGPRTDIAEILYISDIVTLPSYREGVPRTLLEAMSMEKPIVTTDTAGCREVVEEGKNGLLVPLKDPAALASAIGKLLENEELRIRMGGYGREKVLREFDEKIVVRQTLELYEGLLGGKA